jgi:serine/threonine protein kinase
MSSNKPTKPTAGFQKSSPRTSNIAVNSMWELHANDLEMGKVLGRGSFGVVYLSNLHGMDVAVKKIAASASSSETAMAATMLNREVKALSRCRHKNVVQLIGACSNPPMLVLSFASQGTLRDLLRSEIIQLPSRKMELIHGICDGMIMLHSQDILHLDLKPENVLISADGTPWVADFGLAIAMSSTLTGGAGSTKGGRGTMQYKAPEHFVDDSDSDDSDNETKSIAKVTYDKPADVYSFGMMCWEMFSGKVPFAGKMDHKICTMHVKALTGGKIKRPPLDGIPAEVVSFVEACWSQDPSTRPTFRVAKEMLNAVPILAVAGALNAPGYWDIIIGHSRRCAAAVTLATEAATWFEKKGMSVWLDVRMTDRSTAAMEEGVKNSKYFIAVITGPCVNNDAPNDDPIGNAYFRRPYCIKELRWAQEAGKFIQPILRLEDKTQIGNLLGLLDAPLWMDGGDKNISDLKCLGDTSWIELNRNDNEYWDLGMTKVFRALESCEKRAVQKRQSIGGNGETTSSSSTVTSSIERVALEKEIEDRLKDEMKQKNIKKMNVMRAKMEKEYENKAKVKEEAREKTEKEKVPKKKPVSFY